MLHVDLHCWARLECEKRCLYIQIDIHFTSSATQFGAGSRMYRAQHLVCSMLVIYMCVRSVSSTDRCHLHFQGHPLSNPCGCTDQTPPPLPMIPIPLASQGQTIHFFHIPSDPTLIEEKIISSAKHRIGLPIYKKTLLCAYIYIYIYICIYIYIYAQI